MSFFNKNTFEPLYEHEPDRTIRKAQTYIKSFWLVSMLTGFFIFAHLYMDFVSNKPLLYNSLIDFSTTYQVTLNPTDKYELSSEYIEQKPEIQLSDNVKQAVFSSDKVLVFEMKNKWLLLFNYAKYLFFWGICFLVIHQLKKFADTLSTDGFFSMSLVKTTRNVGTIFSIASVAMWGLYLSKIEKAFIDSIVNNLFTLTNGKYFVTTHHSFEFSVVLTIIFLLFGQLFYAFAYLFKRGLQLQKENDLTV